MKKKVKKHERKESKAPEEVSEADKRRARRIRRQKAAQAAADAKKGPDESEDTGSERRDDDVEDAPRRSYQPPAVRKVRVPEVKGRVKTVVTTDNLLKMLGPDDTSKIEFCDRHHDELVGKLTKHNLDHLITGDETRLVARLKSGRIEPLFQSCEALIKLAVQTIGTEGVIFHRCPVCALNRFDFLGQVAGVMKSAVKQLRTVQ